MNITIEKIQAAYRTLGYTPKKFIFIDIKEKKCCPLVAYYLMEENISPEYLSGVGNVSTDNILYLLHSYYGPSRAAGIIRGFDGIMKDSEDMLAYNLGVKLREVLLNEK